MVKTLSTNIAYSKGVPRRFGKTVVAIKLFCTSSLMPDNIAVANNPGAIVLTLIPLDANSLAIGKVMPTMPPFDAEYAACPTCPS